MNKKSIPLFNRIMRSFIPFILFLVMAFSPALAQETLTGPYLGQTPPGATPVVFAPGFISMPGRFDFCGSFSPDGREFYFSVSNPDWSGNSIMCTRMNSDGSWSNPTVMPFSGFDVDWSVYLSNDGQRLFFSSGRPNQSWNVDIWVCDRTDDGGWSDPVPFALNTPFSDFPGPTTKDGTLYFASRSEQPGSVGIFRTRPVNGQYKEAEKLPYPVNTDSLRDGSPCIAPDESYLLFASTRDGSAYNDLYIGVPKPDGSWQVANLGSPINTEKNENLPFLSPDGKYLFFTRDNGRDAVNREVDLYWVGTGVIDSLVTALSIK